jgi:protein-S-isoprenylcysteine O-methyltransferase Ste14
MKNLSLTFFKYRSYTPIPFLLVMFFYQEANIWSLIIGFLIALSGEGMRLWGVSWAGSETRTTGAVGGTFLIISGPFGYVRNPLYVGNILMYAGLGIMSNALFPYLQIGALLFFVIQYYYIVLEEEGYLKTTFGAQFEEYCKNVPRFFPRFTQYKDKSVVQPPLNLKAGLRSEKRTLQAFSFVVITIVLLRVLRTLSF